MFSNGFKNIYSILKIFRTAKEDNWQTFVDELNKIDKSLLDQQIEYYDKDNEKVKKIRIDILNKLKKWSISLSDVEEIKEQEKKNYDYNILKSWTNFSILYSIFYFYHKDTVNIFFTELNNKIVEDLGIKNDVAIKVIGFEWAQHFWLDGFWTAIYNNSHKSQKTALQMNIDVCKKDLWVDKIAVWIWYWPEYHWWLDAKRKIFDINDLTYTNIIEEFQKYKDFILNDNFNNQNEVYLLKDIIKKFINRSFEWKSMSTKDILINNPKYRWLPIKMSFWMGAFAKVTRISFLKPGVKTSDWIYPAILLNIDSKEVVVSYGISETNIAKDEWGNLSKNTIWSELLRDKYSNSFVEKVFRIDQNNYEGNIENIISSLDIVINQYNGLDHSDKTFTWSISNTMVWWYASLNTILYWVPWTGKTYNTINYALSIIEKKPLSEINKEDRIALNKRFDSYKEQGQIVFCTFHQSLSYEEFVEWIKANSDDGNISYDVGNGIFKNIANQANKNWLSWSDLWNQKFDILYLLKEVLWDLDEEHKITINKKKTEFYIYDYNDKTIYFEKKSGARNHTLSIKTLNKMYLDWNSDMIVWWLQWYYEPLLELLIKKTEQLKNIQKKEEQKNYILIIDEINRGNMSKIFGELITLLEPSKRIGAEEELQVKLPYSQDIFGVPQNLYILWTMNTADRSIALIDIALRRRFNFKEIQPDSGLLNFRVWNIDLQKMFETINERIEFLYDRDHRLGHAFFMSLKKNNSLIQLNEIFYNNIIPLLQEYFYEDREKIQIVLGDHAKQGNKKMEDKFIKEEIQNEANIIGFNHEDWEDKSRYVINVNFTEKSYLWIYSKTINEKAD